MRRIRFDWPVVVAAWALLLAATTLLTAGTLYADAVALGGLRAAVGAAPAADRSVRVALSARPADFAALDAAVRGELERVVAAGGGGTVDAFLASGSMSPASEGNSGSTLTILATRPGIERHATLTSGHWPQPNAAVPEAVLSAPAAALLGVTAGGRLDLVDRIHPGAPIGFAVVGIYLPNPNDEWWLGNRLDLQGRSVQGSFTTIGPVVISQDDLLKLAPGGSVNVEWRGMPAVESLTADGLTTLSAAASAFPDRLRAALPGSASPRTQTDLPAILGRVDRSVLVGRSGVLVLVLEFAVVAAYAIVLVAGMLADRRRAETALIRTRGASGGHVAGIALVEALLLAGTAALIAPWISLGVVGVLGTSGALTAARGNLSLSSAALTADGLAAVAGVVAMTLPNLGGIPSLAGVRAAIARQAGRTLGQRLGLDLALVVLAAIALWQLRLYGAPLTSNARGVLGIDPLLVAAPGIGLLAGALLATRLLPRAAEIAEPILARGRGLVGAIGGRGVARRPLRYTRSALLLMLAAALGTFATAHVATWTQSQQDQAAYQAGTDVRVTPSTGAAAGRDIATWAALPGVTGVMAADRLDVDSGRSVRGGAALALDAGAAGPVIDRLPAGDAVGLADGMAALVAARPNPTGIAIPDAARRLSLVVDLGLKIVTDIVPDSGFATGDLKDDMGFQIDLVYADAAGRLHRTSSNVTPLAGTGLRLEVPLDASPATSGGSPGSGRVVRGIEVTIAPTQFYGVGGTIDLGDLEWSTAATPNAGDWTELAPLAAGNPAWSGEIESQQGAGLVMAPYHPPADHPGRLVLGGAGIPQPGELATAFGSGQTVHARIGWLGDLGASVPAPTLGIVASEEFLRLTASHVGDHIAGAIRGSRLDLSIVGRAGEFPTLDPTKPFIVIDAPTLVLARYAANGSTDAPGEWWLTSSDPDATAAAVGAVDPDAIVVSRTQIDRNLRGDPLALGVIGLLGLGSLAAMVFAAIGFIVSATVSTAEREGELALLRALGLSGGQLSGWLSAEHGLLLVAGLGGGVALGVLLAWLVLPFSTLTTTGAVAVPAPVVIVPVDGLLPVVGLAALVFVVTVVVLRRQLLQLRIGSALRARDE